ncbi:DNA/RNA non-specific endonuclease [Spirosoma sp. KUDC1026]|uniref:DNA/RNA non-specific endonuclease n=1 Tax=Spirosoma sp. KUDC1026 TaxID=2745947 RepID=UPI00159BCA91|nr:DNA/RNA non-specific endonuclease [Spirosoma sp. KUDC1026]QKZ12322.1 DNA/RNA non-specific endonuclease [Spirosoma sp. KUDC1026]
MSVKSISVRRPLPTIVFSVVLSLLLSGCFRGSTPKPSANSTQPTRDDHLALGNPSGASLSDPENYLLTKSTYVVSYSRQRGIANWVSWHLSTAWKGDARRANDFQPDPTLPPDWFAVKTSNYTNTGFDRGHLCPSDDRDGSAADNTATFLLTNIVPQAPRHNREVWKNLEDYERELINGGNEAYVIAGTYGTGGTGSNGYATTLANGRLTVPASLWKIIVVLPTGSNDVSRITNTTRVIAVNIPNTQAAADKNWQAYVTSVDELERLTGYDFLSTVSGSVQRQIEARIDGQVN